MPAYVAYDKKTGEIFHVHREYYMGSEEPVELDEEEVSKLIREMYPERKEFALLSTAEELKSVRGYSFYVDLTSKKLMSVESPPSEKGGK